MVNKFKFTKYLLIVTIFLMINQLTLVNGYYNHLNQEEFWFEESSPKKEGVDGDLLEEMVDIIYSFNKNLSISNRFDSVIILKISSLSASLINLQNKLSSLFKPSGSSLILWSFIALIILSFILLSKSSSILFSSNILIPKTA